MTSQTKARSAMDGFEFPNKNGPSPSQYDSINARDAERSFSPSAAAFGSPGTPNAYPIVVLKRSPTVHKS